MKVRKPVEFGYRKNQSVDFRQSRLDRDRGPDLNSLF